MPNYELSISPEYVAGWTFVQAIREIFQNCLDGQTVNPDNKLLFSYDPDTMTLRMGNRHSTLCPSTLVLGKTSKANDDRCIGQFGEGYKLALVVLLRLGKSVTIYNNPNVWTPTLKYSDQFKTTILNINAVKYRFKELPEQDLIFHVAGVTAAEYAAITDSNLHFHEVGETIDTSCGKILMDPRYKGHVYVKGLHVTTVEKAHYGYDLLPQHIEIGRDRDLVNSWQIFYKTSEMWAGTPGQEDTIQRMLDEQAPDVTDIHHHVWKLPKETIKNISCSWYGKHGCNAIPCTTQKQADEAKKLHGDGVKTVIVSQQLLGILQQSEQYKSFKATPVTAVSPHELLKRTMKHLDNFKPSMRGDIKALLAMSVHWDWKRAS